MSKMRGTLVAVVALSGVLALPPLAGAVEQDARAETPPADSRRPPDGIDHTLLGLLGPLLGLPPQKSAPPANGTPTPTPGPATPAAPTPPSFGFLNLPATPKP